MRKYIRKSIFFILLLPILTSCATGPKNYYLVPTGYKTLDIKYWLQDDGFNKIFIMEESQKKLNSWSPGNKYFVDGKYIGKLAYALAMPYRTKKNKITLEIAHIWGSCPMNKLSCDDSWGPSGSKLYGGRTLEIDFSKSNEKYLIAYTDETNISMGGSVLGMIAAHKRLQKTGEPFKFRSVSKDVWWKLHDDLVARGSERMWSTFKTYSDEDLQQARDLQGVSP